MMRTTIVALGFACLLAPTLSLADTPKLPKTPTLESYAFHLFDRSTNRIHPDGKLPDPYGNGVDTLVSVKVAPFESNARKAPVLKLVVHGKAYEDGASGKNPKMVLEFTQPLDVGNNKAQYYLFRVPYLCYPDVVLTATVKGAGKVKPLVETISMACAE